MKKTLLLLSSLAFISSVACANDLIVDGKVKLGFETQNFLYQANQGQDEGLPVFIDTVIDGKNCIVKATAKSIYVQADIKKNSVANINQVGGNNGAIINGNGNSINYDSTKKAASADNVLTINARVISVKCDGSDSIQAQGWIYDKDGNYGVKSLRAGDVVKIAFDPDFKNEKK